MRRQNRYGNPKFEKSGILVDLISIGGVLRTDGTIPRTIDELLLKTPLTVQAVAYDASNQRVFEETGLCAIKSMTVEIQNVLQLAHHAAVRSVDADDYVLWMAATSASRQFLLVVENNRKPYKSSGVLLCYNIGSSGSVPALVRTRPLGRERKPNRVLLTTTGFRETTVISDDR